MANDCLHSKSKLLVLTLFLFASNYLFAQEQIKKYIVANTIKIETIQPNSTDFSDLQAIGDAIGDAKIVMMGEQDHGDAPTFLGKTRLIKYLHEKKGFDVLAFENDFFSTNYNWTFVKSGKLSVDSFIKTNISATWARCTACDPLFKEYLPSTLISDNPLEISGFDMYMNTRKLLPKLDSIIKNLRLPVTQTADYASQIFPKISSWYMNTKDSVANKEVNDYLLLIKNQLLAKLSEDDFWIRCVDNLIAENKKFNNWRQNYFKDINTRDRQMAANLKWLAEVKYPNSKIIVWGHNYHISKYSGHYPEKFLNGQNTMGSVFTEDTSIMKKTYILGFTSYEGTAGRLFFGKIYKVDKPKTNSLENWINKKYNFAFVDFKKYNTANPLGNEAFNMSGATKGNRYHSSQSGIWNRIFDGVFYIKEMYPCSSN